MAILKFRVSIDDDESIYRDIAIMHKQNFLDFHLIILKAYDFDSKHDATFYRTNDGWQKGREISQEIYNKKYIVEPLLMKDTNIGSEITDPNQKFIYEYDFTKKWTFLIELINVSKEEDIRLIYPAITRIEGIGPPQYGTKSILGDKFTDIEEKYDLSENAEGFGKENDDEFDTEDFGLDELPAEE
jgi:Plasmid pRiA4b ORF-3-like protein